LGAIIGLDFLNAHSSINNCVAYDQIHKHAQTFYNYMTNDSTTSTSTRLDDDLSSAFQDDFASNSYVPEDSSINVSFDDDFNSRGYFPDDSSYDVSFNDCDSFWDKLTEIPFQLILVAMAFLMSFLLVNSFMTGSIMHAVAEVHSGNDSLSVSRSLNHGFKKMCNIFTFNALLMLGPGYSIVIILFAIVLGITVFFASLKLNVLSGIIFYILGIVFMVVVIIAVKLVMMGGTPSIIVEGVSPIGAFRRSYNICKGSIRFIFTTAFCYQVLAFITGLSLNALQSASPNSVALFFGLIRFVMKCAIQVLGVALTIVLYISIRVRSEGLTQQQLAQELGQNIVHDVSLEDDYKDDDNEMRVADTKTLV